VGDDVVQFTGDYGAFAIHRLLRLVLVVSVDDLGREDSAMAYIARRCTTRPAANAKLTPHQQEKE
jgi:hypothetical protein